MRGFAILSGSLIVQKSEWRLLAHRNMSEESIPVPVCYNQLSSLVDEKTDWLAFLDQHIELAAPDALKRIESQLNELGNVIPNAGVWGLAGWVCENDRPVFVADQPIANYPSRTLPYQVDTLDDMALFIRPGVLREIGGFEDSAEQLSHVGYSSDLCLRARTAGLSSWVISAPVRYLHKVTDAEVTEIPKAVSWITHRWGSRFPKIGLLSTLSR
jgi:hypothetical protein